MEFDRIGNDSIVCGCTLRPTGTYLYRMMSSLGRVSVPRTAVSFHFFFCGLVFSTWAARIPDVKDHFRLNDAQLGALLLMLPLGSVSALPVAGWIIDRMGSRLVTTVSAALYAVSLWSLAVAPTLPSLTVLLFVFGFLGDMLNISMNTQGLSVQRMIGKPILSGLHAMWSFGALTGVTLAGRALKAGMGTASHFLSVSMPVAIVVLIISQALVSDPTREGEGRRIFVRPDRALLLIGLICFCNTLSEGAMADWSSLYYRDALGGRDGVSTAGYMSFTLAMTIGRLAGDGLIRRIGYRRMLMANGLLIAAGMLLAVGWMQPMAVMAGFALVGLGVSSVIPICYMIAGKSQTMAPAAALAAVSAVGFTGFLIGPPIIGFVAHEVTLRSSLLLVALMGLLVFGVSARSIGTEAGR